MGGEPDQHSSVVVNGQLTVIICIAKKYGENMTLVMTSSGKNVDISGSNLCTVVKDGYTDIHYATEKADGREHGKDAIGRDKGYTEAFTDLDGAVHGDKFGSVLTQYSDKTAMINKQRHKLHAIEKKQRRMSSWARGVLVDALDFVCEQRKAGHVLVNGAYTSQMDSTSGLPEGKRVGDRFYRNNGDVLRADCNAALNVLARLDDSGIFSHTPSREVRRILLVRSPAQLSVNKLESGVQTRQPSTDKSFVQVIRNRSVMI